jgi:lincosamide nucleotidyltransferase A/C/D/E
MPPRTMTAADVTELLDRLRDEDIDVWIDGGWGVDALLGEQTRLHEDLDIVVQTKYVSKLRNLLEARGYREHGCRGAM